MGSMQAKFTREFADISAVGTILQVHAANSARPLQIVDFGVYGQGVNNLGKPLLFQLVIQSDAGTGGGANTPVKLSRENSNSIEATGRDDSVVYSVEPTDTDILHEWLVHPQGGKEHPLVKPYEIASDERVAIRVMEAPGETVKWSAYIEIEE
jgi:hypothetical protein